MPLQDSGLQHATPLQSSTCPGDTYLGIWCFMWSSCAMLLLENHNYSLRMLQRHQKAWSGLEHCTWLCLFAEMQWVEASVAPGGFVPLASPGPPLGFAAIHGFLSQWIQGDACNGHCQKPDINWLKSGLVPYNILSKIGNSLGRKRTH